MKSDANEILSGYHFLSHEKLRPNLYKIVENYGKNIINIYVLIGNECAVVIDSGLGLHDSLRSYIEEFITGPELPLVCVMTHGGPDHLGGSNLFDECYMGYAELWLDQGEQYNAVVDPHGNTRTFIDWGLDPERRLSDLDFFSGGDQLVIDYCSKHYVPNAVDDSGEKRWKKWHYVKDGEVLQFGNIKLQAIWVKGHTAGSTCWVNWEDNYVFSGDVSSKSNNMNFLEDSLPATKRFASMIPEDMVLYNGHEVPRPKSIIYDEIRCLEEVIEGKNLENDPVLPSMFKMLRKDMQTKVTKAHTYGFSTVQYKVAISK